MVYYFANLKEHDFHIYLKHVFLIVGVFIYEKFIKSCVSIVGTHVITFKHQHISNPFIISEPLYVQIFLVFSYYS